MKRRRRSRRSAESVELNLAAMLDMAFQILVFFILTFSPMPIESQIAAMLPALGPVTQSMLPDVSGNAAAVQQPDDVRPVTVTVLASNAGSIRNLAVDRTIVPNLQALRDQLQRTTDGLVPCSLVLQVDAKLHYQQLLHVVDACTQGGVSESRIDKMTFVELRQQR
jgi:biopolymer transport protein ExbD